MYVDYWVVVVAALDDVGIQRNLDGLTSTIVKVNIFINIII